MALVPEAAAASSGSRGIPRKLPQTRGRCMRTVGDRPTTRRREDYPCSGRPGTRSGASSRTFSGIGQTTCILCSFHRRRISTGAWSLVSPPLVRMRRVHRLALRVSGQPELVDRAVPALAVHHELGDHPADHRRQLETMTTESNRPVQAIYKLRPIEKPSQND